MLDRPWGQTLGTVAMRKLDAQVSVHADDGKTYAIAFVQGAIAAAMSPLPNDSITRVALTSHFVSPTQVGELTRRLAAEKRDEVEIIAEAGRLSADQATTLRRRVTIQRAARTFAIDRGTFEIDDQVVLPTLAGFSVPLGAVVFQGVRMNLSEQRLVEDLREIGTSFILKPTVTDADLASYGFEGDIRSVVAALRKGTSLAELELASHRDLEPRTLHAMVYALVCGAHCNAAGGQPVDRSAAPRASAATSTPRPAPSTTSQLRIRVDQPLVTRARTTTPPANVVARTISQDQARTQPGNFATRQPPTPTVPPRTHTVTTPPRTTTPPPMSSPRAPTTPPASRTPTNPPTSRTSTSSGTIPPRTVTPTAQPPLRSATMPPRPQTVSSSPLDDFIRESTTNRGLTGIDGTGPHAILEEFSREVSTSRGVSSSTKLPAMPRTITAPRTITERHRAKREIEALIVTRLARLEQACDYFAILGLPFEAPLDAVRNNYVETSRRLHPESLAQVEITDEPSLRAAQRVLAQVNAAFTVLTDSSKRRDYVAAVRRGEPTPIAPRARTGELDKTELAAEAFEAGEGALKRDDIPRAVEELGRAVTLAPTNLEYMAMFAWAQFCAAGDKRSIYVETRKALERAIHRGDKPIVARFYLGRVERMIGHDREAMNHFQEVLLDEPNHKEAASEVRVLEQRLAKGTKPKR